MSQGKSTLDIPFRPPECCTIRDGRTRCALVESPVLTATPTMERMRDCCGFRARGERAVTGQKRPSLARRSGGRVNQPPSLTAATSERGRIIGLVSTRSQSEDRPGQPQKWSKRREQSAHERHCAEPSISPRFTYQEMAGGRSLKTPKASGIGPDPISSFRSQSLTEELSGRRGARQTRWDTIVLPQLSHGHIRSGQ